MQIYHIFEYYNAKFGQNIWNEQMEGYIAIFKKLAMDKTENQVTSTDTKSETKLVTSQI